MWKRIGQDVKAYGRTIFVLVLLTLLLVKLFGAACILKLVTGFPCPACGMTRAAVLFMRGQIRESIQLQPLFVLVLIGAALFFFCRYVFRRYEAFLKYYAVFLIGFALVLYCYRMVRYFPDAAPVTYWEESLLGRIKRIVWERM